jgi:hypothetical protein
MKFLIGCFVFFISIGYSYSNDTIKNTLTYKNNIKIALWPGIKATIAYERAITNKMSVGCLYSRRGGRFNGDVISIYGRYYAKLKHEGGAFNQNGVFFEVKATYAKYYMNAYTSYDKADSMKGFTYNGDYNYYGGQTTSADYFGLTTSIGYKRYCNKHFFFEFMGGLRFGLANFENSNLILKQNSTADELNIGKPPNIKNAFYWAGPGFPLEVSIAAGFEF